MNNVTQMQQDTQEKLRQIILRIERLETEKAELSADVAEIKAEAKSIGFESKIINRVLALRKLDPADRSDLEAKVDLYMSAVE